MKASSHGGILRGAFCWKPRIFPVRTVRRSWAVDIALMCTLWVPQLGNMLSGKKRPLRQTRRGVDESAFKHAPVANIELVGPNTPNGLMLLAGAGLEKNPNSARLSRVPAPIF